MFVCPSVSQTVCPQPCWSILGPQFTTYYIKALHFLLEFHLKILFKQWDAITSHWVLYSVLRNLRPRWSMLPRTCLESTKSIISLDCLPFDATEYWCIISFKVINILSNLSFLVYPSVDLYGIHSNVHVGIWVTSTLNISVKELSFCNLGKTGNHQENGHHWD